MIIGVMQLSYNEKVVPDRFRPNYLSFKVYFGWQETTQLLRALLLLTLIFVAHERMYGRIGLLDVCA